MLLGRDPKFRRFALAGAFGGGTSLYGYFDVIPFLLTSKFHQPISTIGPFCLTVVVGMTLGTFLARRLTGRLHVLAAARLGNWVSLAAAIGLIAFSVTHLLSIGSLLTLMIIYAVGVGLTSPNALAGLLEAQPERAGTASSIFGFGQMVAGSALTLGVSFAPAYPALAIVGSLISSAIITRLCLT